MALNGEMVTCTREREQSDTRAMCAATGSACVASFEPSRGTTIVRNITKTLSFLLALSFCSSKGESRTSSLLEFRIFGDWKSKSPTQKEQSTSF
jgi:hypothetical protein